MVNIKEQRLLYHLTSVRNIPSILQHGLKPRSMMGSTIISDVADQEILKSRQTHNLDSYVPFHFFCKNPFDGRVQKDRQNEKFALITVQRSFAQNNNWKIIPRHPLAGSLPSILDYDDGFNQIDWDIMNTKDYHDTDCKSVCMAECLSPGSVNISNFFKIWVCCEESKAIIDGYTSNVIVEVKNGMFVST